MTPMYSKKNAVSNLSRTCFVCGHEMEIVEVKHSGSVVYRCPYCNEQETVENR